jgi:uncharacterized repeat protein (TIGR01451 family)
MSSTATATIRTTKLTGVASSTVNSAASTRLHLTVTYILTYGNPGGAGVAANLSFPLPAGTTFVSASGGGTNTSGVVSWSLGTLAAGSAARQTVVLQVPSTAGAGSQLAADAALRRRWRRWCMRD